MTRLITAREPEPEETSHLIRFADTTLVFGALWQVLQETNWPDARLAQLQHEWESVDFFTNLPAMERLEGASAVARCENARNERAGDAEGFVAFMETVLRFPLSAPYELRGRQAALTYNQRQCFEDESEMLRYYHDRELQMQKAARAPTWPAMRDICDDTNTIFEGTNRRSRYQPLLGEMEFGRSFKWREERLPARAAEAEAQRRILITALALERYRIAHGAYPKTLAGLVPEILKVPPADFMDGRPLRYRLTDDGHFMAYSVGLGGVDNGGKLRRRMGDPGYQRPAKPGEPEPAYAIVWPRPAGRGAYEEEERIKSEAKKTEARRKSWSTSTI